ncbi:MAG: Uma2 family endonuclease [Bacteroidota bacterium]
MGEPKIQEDRRDYSVEEYLAILEQSDIKLEYFDGEIRAMTGGTRNHSKIAANVIALLVSGVDANQCSPFGSDLRVYSPTTQSHMFPDAMVVCGEEKFQDERNDILLNPTVIVEVLSPSTMHYDFVEKFDKYKRIPSLREYVLISQDRYRVEVRSSKDDWGQIQIFEGRESKVELSSISLVVDMEAIYRQVTFEQ